MAAHRGGTFTMLAKGAGGSLDPQINYTLQYWQLYQATQDGLVAFKHAAGTKAFTLVPDLAVALPKPTDGGKTWTFKLRKGIKYSTGATVQPRDFLWTFQRIFKVHTPTAGGFYSVLVGADKCLKTPATCDLSKGVVIDNKAGTVTFHLTKPDAEWLYKLAVPHASVLPWGTPNKDLGTKLPPSTGAYMFTKYDPNHELVLKRNPNFKQWSADAQPDGFVDSIVQKFGLSVEAEVTQIENGQADWLFDFPPADRLNEIGTKYPKQVHINTLFADWYVPMNVNLAAVQQQARAPGGQLGDRPQRGRPHLRRAQDGRPGLPDAAARVPGLRRLLPLHEEPGQRQVERARPGQGQGARQAVGHGRP